MLIIHHEINIVSVALLTMTNLMATITFVRTMVIIFKNFLYDIPLNTEVTPWILSFFNVITLSNLILYLLNMW